MPSYVPKNREYIVGGAGDILDEYLAGLEELLVTETNPAMVIGAGSNNIFRADPQLYELFPDGHGISGGLMQYLEEPSAIGIAEIDGAYANDDSKQTTDNNQSVNNNQPTDDNQSVNNNQPTNDNQPTQITGSGSNEYSIGTLQGIAGSNDIPDELDREMPKKQTPGNEPAASTEDNCVIYDITGGVDTLPDNVDTPPAVMGSYDQISDITLFME